MRVSSVVVVLYEEHAIRGLGVDAASAQKSFTHSTLCFPTTGSLDSSRGKKLVAGC